MQCRLAVEEDCIRLGMFNRWHSACLSCRVCGDRASPPKQTENEVQSPISPEDGQPSFPFTPSRRPPPRVDDFFFEPFRAPVPAPEVVICVDHRTQTCIAGFASVSRLEQYAFLLHIALRRLYVHFRQHHDLPSGESVPLTRTTTDGSARKVA